MSMIDFLIAGGGPAGLTAALYAARAGLEPVILEGLPGGRLQEIEKIENYPGFSEGIRGFDLAAAMRAQALRFGTVFRMGESLESLQLLPDGSFRCAIDSGETLETRCILLATGTEPARLGIPGEDKFLGHGVSTCATCDGAFFKNKDVLVAGTEADCVAGALYLSRICRHVLVSVVSSQKPSLTAALNRARQTPDIEWLDNTVPLEILPRNDSRGVGAVRLRNPSGTFERAVDGVFVLLGDSPAVRPLGSLLPLGPDGGIIVNPDSGSTSIPGLFAAGDVLSGAVRQVATAVGSACTAAMGAIRYLHRSAPPAST
ncbi:MAG: NAD(P)/FAD-dependent oxidoreductase [Kiritimatiellia bacterium]